MTITIWEALEKRLAHHRKEVKAVQRVAQSDRVHLHERTSGGHPLGPSVLEAYLTRAHEHEAAIGAHEAVIRELESLLLMKPE